jgi:hypothetical protein
MRSKRLVMNKHKNYVLVTVGVLIRAFTIASPTFEPSIISLTVFKPVGK